MRILILGGDGYLGWPTAMNLAAHGHEIIVADNYLRRSLCRETSSEPLFEVPNLQDRAVHWFERTGQKISVAIGNLADWTFAAGVFEQFLPEAVIHYAEQPSGPYSMMNRGAAATTLNNNLGTTFNVIFAVKEFCPDCHIIKLGTMGEYGTPNIDIEEGWLDIKHKGREGRFLFPRQAGSLYHTTKIMDTDLLWFYVRNWGLRVTDLMQGPVYGMETEESGVDQRLMPFFNYDEIFGTVLNRFVVQAVAGFPLTVYGAGGQTRGFLNIKDTLSCVKLAALTPPDKGQLRIFNQFTEVFSVNDLASHVQRAGRLLGYDVMIKSIANPRQELEEHYYNPAHTGLLELGLEPHLLTDNVLAGMLETVARNADRIDQRKFLRGVKWA
ncbi:MAG: NAD-dependent epimerase/dehydratase family protein [Alphaproteobacteria bacterium]|nr:NAD-dependent epimerase/dehydratase family protein [Alphaproteobacteria bacterium]